MKPFVRTKCGLSVRKSGWPVSSKGTGPRPVREPVMTGWKLARLFPLGVALRGTASPASLIGFISKWPATLVGLKFDLHMGGVAGNRFARSLNLLLRCNISATPSGTDLAVSAFWRER